MKLDKSQPSFRIQRIKKLKEACGYISECKKRFGAFSSDSPDFDFDKTYNSGKQRELYGYRSKEAIGKMADEELKKAKHTFAVACSYCEYNSKGGSRWCGDKEKKRKIFWRLYNASKRQVDDNGKVKPKKEPDEGLRNLFRGRIRNKLVKAGIKSAPCKRLLNPEQLKKAEWDWA